MSRIDAEARLNATERLSAEDATRNARIIEMNAVDYQPSALKALQAYADILEGKDD